VEVDPGEEAGCVGRLARLSERARGERALPACGRQCTSERARDLRRAAAEERRDDESAALTMVLASRIACYLHGLILVHQPHAAARAWLPLPPKRNGGPRALQARRAFAPREDRRDPRGERTFPQACPGGAAGVDRLQDARAATVCGRQLSSFPGPTAARSRWRLERQYLGWREDERAQAGSSSRPLGLRPRARCAAQAASLGRYRGGGAAAVSGHRVGSRRLAGGDDGGDDRCAAVAGLALARPDGL
jgi:hypothetical protein